MNLLTLLTPAEVDALKTLSRDLQISLNELLEVITGSDQANEQIVEFLQLLIA